MKYAEKLKDPRWQRKRLEILNRDNFTCISCLSRDIELHVHHVAYAKSGNPWDANDTDMVTLCKECHYLMTTLGEPGFTMASDVFYRFFTNRSILERKKKGDG